MTSPQKNGFSLIEVTAALAVLVILALLIAQLLNGATAVSLMGEKRIGADAQSRILLDRVAIDLSQMLKNPAVDYFLKNPGLPQAGNDQLAFFSQVRGYYRSAGARSPYSLVSYRINESDVRLERLGEGLVWNGVSATDLPLAYLPQTIKTLWPHATNQNSDPDYETVGPDVFRFEYAYLIKGKVLPNGTTLPALTSKTPWDTRPGVAHSDVSGLRDVESIIFQLAIIDPASRKLATNSTLTSLGATLNDFDDSVSLPDLETQWRNAIAAASLPKAVSSAVRVYRRTVPLRW